MAKDKDSEKEDKGKFMAIVKKVSTVDVRCTYY